MNLIPPMPTWQSLHVEVIHFPISLLIVAPVLILIGLAAPRERAGFSISGLVIMTLGLAAIYLATASGDAAAHAAPHTPQIRAAIHNHSEMADLTELLFSILTPLYAVILIGPWVLKKKVSRMASTVAQLVFLVFYSGALLVLAQTAHRGGILVHGLGVHAELPPGSIPAAILDMSTSPTAKVAGGERD